MFQLTELFDLTGKVALVTGSSRGLGYSIAEGLAKAGATIILNGRNPDRLAETRQTFQDNGFTAHAAQFDVTNMSEITAAVAEIQETVGTIDILVNNAGIQYREPLEEFDEDQWRNVMDVNINGVFLTSKAVAPGMIAQKSGKIINIGSLMSEVGRNTISAYVTSKGAVKQLTKNMAVEWAKHNIQANAIGPGYFKTDINTALYNDVEFDTWLKARTPANRWGEPEELVGIAVFLASKASSFVNGQIFYIDGGVLATI